MGTANHPVLEATYIVTAQQNGDHKYKVKPNKAAHFCSSVTWSCAPAIVTLTCLASAAIEVHYSSRISRDLPDAGMHKGMHMCRDLMQLCTVTPVTVFSCFAFICMFR